MSVSIHLYKGYMQLHSVVVITKALLDVSHNVATITKTNSTYPRVSCWPKSLQNNSLKHFILQYLCALPATRCTNDSVTIAKYTAPKHCISKKFCVMIWPRWYVISDHQPCTTTTKGSEKGILRGWFTNCQNLREQQDMHHPRIALAMFIMAFVGVVRGLWGLTCHSVLIPGQKRETQQPGSQDWSCISLRQDMHACP